MKVRFSFSSRRTGRIEGHNRHRQPFPKIAKEVIRISDVVLEVLDIRFINETRNIEIENFVKDSGKKLIFVLNKADLINPEELKMNVDLSDLSPYIIFSCKSKIGRENLRKVIKIEIKKLKVNHKKAHVGIIGYPNTGKSSLINLLVGRKSSGTSAQAGFTRGIQRIRLNRDILILDTPGVLPERENASAKTSDLKREAKIGVRTYDKVREPDLIVSGLIRENPDLFDKFYGIKINGDVEVLLETVGRKRGLLIKGNRIDVDRTARVILRDWQEGKITKQNLEKSDTKKK